ncbi:MAG: DUF177 domain-containing protein [Lachnospiraceae bacterium]|nr:DUF177 domain-containing protein [Lachnospiraceae bacterium]
MLIDLTKVLSQDGNVLSQEAHLDMTEISVHEQQIAVSELQPLEVIITNTDNGILLIQAKGKVRAMIPCARCLEEVPYDMVLDFERKVDAKLSEQEREQSEEEYNFLLKTELDTDVLLRNELLINWPIRVLCKEDCKGICSRCGANLNHGDCGCDRASIDPRMAAISDIFSKFKEV